MVIIEIYTLCPVAILIYTLEIYNHRPSGNINAVPEFIKLIHPVPISINASSGNINIVL